MAEGHDNQHSDPEVARAQMLARVLAWYEEMGVEDAAGHEPVDWIARGPVPPARFEVAKPSASPQRKPVDQGSTPASSPRDEMRPPAQREHTPPVVADRSPAALPASTVMRTDEEAETHAREQARQAKSLDELRALLESFDGCGLRATAKNTCFYRGAADARVMVIGEAPGRDEDRAGVPFVGRAGQLLDKMLAAIDLSEADTHITNVVYWRPPGNRVPTPQETLVCRPFLERQIRLVAPDLIVTVGGSAAKLVLGTPHGIMKVRGKWQTIEVPGLVQSDVAGQPDAQSLEIPVMPTLHPAFLLRTPAQKRLAWRDLLAIRQRLGETE